MQYRGKLKIIGVEQAISAGNTSPSQPRPLESTTWTGVRDCGFIENMV